MALLLVLLFIVVPIVELFVIIQIGQAIGVLPTIALLILDSVLGAALMRSQGRAAWLRFNRALAEGRDPGPGGHGRRARDLRRRAAADAGLPQRHLRPDPAAAADAGDRAHGAAAPLRRPRSWRARRAARRRGWAGCSRSKRARARGGAGPAGRRRRPRASRRRRRRGHGDRGPARPAASCRDGQRRRRGAARERGPGVSRRGHVLVRRPGRAALRPRARGHRRRRGERLRGASSPAASWSTRRPRRRSRSTPPTAGTRCARRASHCTVVDAAGGLDAGLRRRRRRVRAALRGALGPRRARPRQPGRAGRRDGGLRAALRA